MEIIDFDTVRLYGSPEVGDEAGMVIFKFDEKFKGDTVGDNEDLVKFVVMVASIFKEDEVHVGFEGDKVLVYSNIPVGKMLEKCVIFINKANWAEDEE